MSVPPNQRQVSLRGASAREITRDALLDKVSHERELRSYLRRASLAALLIQRVWRRLYVLKKVSEQLQEEWDALANEHGHCLTTKWVSDRLLPPFLFFISRSAWSHQKQELKNVRCASACFRILLSSINSTDIMKNFCSLAVGTDEERYTWLYQTKKLLSLCFSILAECNFSHTESESTVSLAALAMRLAVSLTDPKSWKSITSETYRDADVSISRLIGFMSSRESGLYNCVRGFIRNLGSNSGKLIGSKDDQILITASAITLALRPFHCKKMVDFEDFDVSCACEEYFIFILTVPNLNNCLPSLLLPALRHQSVLEPCLRAILIREERIFEEIQKTQLSEKPGFSAKNIPYSGWVLANIINLSTESDNGLSFSGHFIQGLDCSLYVNALNSISRNCLNILESNKQLNRFNIEEQDVDSDYIDLLKPVYQQWHLKRLLSISNESENQGRDHIVVYFYYYMLRIFAFLNPVVGSLALLNVLSFNTEFVMELWDSLEDAIFKGGKQTTYELKHSTSNGTMGDTGLKRSGKDTGNKWSTVLQKIKGKSTDNDDTMIAESSLSTRLSNEAVSELWDIEAVRHGPNSVSKDLSCTLHLFCATYGHLLLVLDDIEFYEKQVPFMLEQQRKIASLLNTLVYNSFINNIGQASKPLIDVATRCLHLLYERDCRHKFCPDSLWLAPARKGRVPIAAAVRAHEAAFNNVIGIDSSAGTITSSVLTVVPHVFPFEERVKMFREFIKLDKISRRVSGPSQGSIEIVVRRDRIIEDGYRQLSSIGLKSSIHVSFISECGLPEAGLDYGGLFKEFLTDFSKAAFNPEFGLFTQSSTVDSSLIPKVSARLLENGIEMIEFLGRVVGKALYEGILLDYSFSLVFVQKLLGRYSFLDELSTLDSELYRNLMYLKHFEGDATDLSLDFTVTEELHGKMVVHELRPGGKDVPVTNENKLQYVHAMADFKLNRQILPFANAFYRGLSDLISPSWLSLFNANEFNQLLSGGRQDFDIDDLRSNTKYTGGYSDSSRTVKLFWEVIKGFSPNERCMLLKFVTSCSRAPLLGFKYLQPSFTIHKVPCDVPLWATIGGQDVDRLPSASTCYNTLKLPTYKRSSALRNKLLYAISSNTGFELS